MNPQNGPEGNPDVRVFDFSEKGTTGLARIISGKGRGFSIATLIFIGLILAVFLSMRDALPLFMILIFVAQYSIAAFEISFDNENIYIVTWKRRKKFKINKIKRVTVTHHKYLHGISTITLRQRYKLNFYLIRGGAASDERHDLYLELKQYVDRRFNSEK